MYNFNMSLSTPPMLGVDICSQTPRTPEILNSLIAMTNPLDLYSFTPSCSQMSMNNIPQSTATVMTLNPSPMVGGGNSNHHHLQHHKPDILIHHFDNASCSSTSSSIESPSETPPQTSTPSLQQTRSQLIKEGVKLLIQNKRKNSCSSSCDTDHKPPPLKQFIRAANVTSLTVVEQQQQQPVVPLTKSINIPIDVIVTTALSLQSPDDGGSNSGGFQIKTDDTSSCDEDSESKFSASGHGLTPEDEDRRRRRRERNKIAATKCRMKKRERTMNLMQESEILESQNVDLKGQMKDLENQRRKLTEMLRLHQMECKNSVAIAAAREQNNNNNQVTRDGNRSKLERINGADNQLKSNQRKDSNNNNNNKQQQQPQSTPLHELQHDDIDNEQLPSLTSIINCKYYGDEYNFGIEMFDDDTSAQQMPSQNHQHHNHHNHHTPIQIKSEDHQLYDDTFENTFNFDDDTANGLKEQQQIYAI